MTYYGFLYNHGDKALGVLILSAHFLSYPLDNPSRQLIAILYEEEVLTEDRFTTAAQKDAPPPR
jgi:hypothetical protein